MADQQAGLVCTRQTAGGVKCENTGLYLTSECSVGAVGLAQLAECLLRVHKALGSINHIATCLIPRGSKVEGSKFDTSLGLDYTTLSSKTKHKKAKLLLC